MNRLSLAAFATLALLSAASSAYSHGVERGLDLSDALQLVPMKASLRDEVLENVRSRCDLREATGVEAQSSLKVEEVDQGASDLFHTVRIVVTQSGLTEVILVQAAEYEIANPSVPNQAVLSIQSRLCR